MIDGNLGVSIRGDERRPAWTHGLRALGDFVDRDYQLTDLRILDLLIWSVTASEELTSRVEVLRPDDDFLGAGDRHPARSLRLPRQPNGVEVGSYSGPRTAL